jgi:hypothetical protein
MNSGVATIFSEPLDLPSLRAVSSTSRKPACKPYWLEAGPEANCREAPSMDQKEY